MNRYTPFAVMAVALVAASPAAAKEGVEATLTTPVPLDAPAGARIDVAWTLTSVDEDVPTRPFDAGGIFIRLVSASGVPGKTVYARGDRGEYAATVVVPESGIGDVQIGLVGWRSDASGTRRADVVFPITNDPAPANLLRPAPADSPARWVLVFVGGLSALAVLAIALVPRRPLGRFG